MLRACGIRGTTEISCDSALFYQVFCRTLLRGGFIAVGDQVPDFTALQPKLPNIW